jgi:hypothetical protein
MLLSSSSHELSLVLSLTDGHLDGMYSALARVVADAVVRMRAKRERSNVRSRNSAVAVAAGRLILISGETLDDSATTASDVLRR